MSHQTVSSKDRLRLWLYMLKNTRSIENELREMLRVEHETTLPRFDVLAALDHNREGLRMSELSKQLMVSNGNVTGIIDRLSTEGMVEKITVQTDKRATLVRLTKKGLSYFKILAADHESWVDKELNELSGKEIDEMISTFKKIRKDRT